MPLMFKLLLVEMQAVSESVTLLLPTSRCFCPYYSPNIEASGWTAGLCLVNKVAKCFKNHDQRSFAALLWSWCHGGALLTD